MKFKILLILSLFLSVQNLTAQEDNFGDPILTGWDFGMNFGYYFPSAFHAKFYDGSAENVNNINYIFNNKYYRDEIRNSLNSSDTFFISAMPQKMRYTGAFMIGLYFRRTYDKYFGFSVQFNYSKLHANDFFQIEVDPYYILTEPDLRIFPIWGIEERVNIDLNFSKYFHAHNEILVPFLEAGININSTRVKENMIQINDLKYSLVNVYLNGTYVPGASQTQYHIQQGGVGWGVSAGGGLKLVFSEAVSIDPGFSVYYQKINLEHYEQFRPGITFYIRLSLTGFFNSYE